MNASAEQEAARNRASTPMTFMMTLMLLMMMRQRSVPVRCVEGVGVRTRRGFMVPVQREDDDKHQTSIVASGFLVSAFFSADRKIDLLRLGNGKARIPFRTIGAAGLESPSSST